ncbi:fasciclin domain-containing protein [Flavobacterium sp. F-328]|uniref:Fasciclin domain-containing protein n=1 Tax=Flavobacterium erciyesense TaxID=2825842 RepID=A0ABS5D7G5_9FLAO|nr:fasciclin domain-containing protein [Flavobacterium erciyesense]MBQ0909931.1 fasciclin domain-containing protein [Flavobacterium erciyesense]
MKNAIKFKSLLMIALLAIFSVSCDNDDDKAVADETITGLAVKSPNLSILVQALTRANLATTLQGSGSFTVFAPTDAAFTAFLQANNFANINQVPQDVLTRILLNHVVSGNFRAANLQTGYIKTLATSATSGNNTMSMFVNTASGVRLNGVASVTTPDVVASNGVIHIVDAVINLPTIVTHATANPNFTSLVGALTGQGQPNFVEILSGTGPFTVFAPTNAAFTSLNTELAPGGIASVSAANLTRVLRYHVVSGNVLAASLMAGSVATLETPQSFTVSLTGGAKITDVRNRVANVTATDVQCSNGVIHVLDKVLLPTFPAN